jgi:hypothetical protein
MSCPWSELTPGTLNFCESAQCAWIAQPANAWSSLIYVGVGGWLLAKDSAQTPLAIRMIGPIAILVGLGSFFFHASLSFVGQSLDIGSMLLFSALLLTLNLRRLGWLSSRNWLGAYVVMNLISFLLMVKIRPIGPYVFAFEAILSILLELRLMKVEMSVENQQVSRQPYFLALGIFAFSYGIWILDYHRIICAPESHFLQGHAAWHLLNSSVFILLHRYYGQFEWELVDLRNAFFMKRVQ